MGWKHISSLKDDDVNPPSKERVEENNKIDKNDMTGGYTNHNKTKKRTYAEIVKGKQNEKLNEQQRRLIQLR